MIVWRYHMELFEVLQKRRSVRRFTDEAVSKEDLDAMMHAAMSGPSACNAKPWAFYAVEDASMLQKLNNATKYTNINAPLAIVVCGDLSKAMPSPLRDFWVQDCSAATENVLLAATALGLGAVWCGIYPVEQSVGNVREALGIPDAIVPLNIVYIGHPTQTPEPRDQYDEGCVHIV